MRREAISNFLNNFDYEKSNPLLNWDDYFMKLTHIIKERSSCIHRKVGAILVRENRILCTGYNQPPSGFPHCDETECIRDALEITSGESQEICYAAHAEQNAIAQAAKFGISTRNSTIYITHKPCSICARILINAGIVRVVYGEEYPDPLTEFLFEKTGVKMELYRKTGG